MVITNKVEATVQVCRDGVWETLPEYRVERNDRMTTCYVASEEGLHFRVRCQDTRTSDNRHATWIECFVDGEKCSAHIMHGKLLQRMRATFFNGHTVDNHSERPFLFAKVTLPC